MFYAFRLKINACTKAVHIYAAWDASAIGLIRIFNMQISYHNATRRTFGFKRVCDLIKTEHCVKTKSIHNYFSLWREQKKRNQRHGKERM